MTDAPERLWAQKTAGDNWDEPIASPHRVGHFYEYIRADLAKPTVKLLEWVECADGSHHTSCCRYEVEKIKSGRYVFWRLVRGVTGGSAYIGDFGGGSALDAAKAAAQDHYTAQIMKALGVSDE